MSVSARDFASWLNDSGLPTGTAELSRTIGLKRTTLQNQRIRGRITVQTVIAAARAAQLNPLDVLGRFPGYEALVDQRRPVSAAELLSQVTHSDALVHLLSQISADYAHRLAGVKLSDIPNEESVRAWVDAIDPGDLRRQVAEHSGMAPSNFSTQLTDNKLTPELAILVSRICGVSSASGLVVSGFITPSEAGWPIYGRENALLEMGDIELIDLVTARLATLRRTTKKKVDATEANKHYLETLG